MPEPGGAVASVNDIKPRVQVLLRPLAKRMEADGKTPDALSVPALAGSVAVGLIIVALAGDQPLILLLLPVWLIVRMALDVLDGMLAPETITAVALGAVARELGAVLSDLALYVPLALVAPAGPWWAAGAWTALAIGALLTEFCGLLGSALGGSRRYDGPMGTSSRAIFVSLAAILLAFYPPAWSWIPWAVWAAVLLEALTCYNRLAGALSEASSSAEADEARSAADKTA